jgi:hypothetical protein
MDIPRHSIRYGKASETKILEKHQDTFDTMVLNATSLAYFGRSLSGFVFIKSKGKNFFIDPLTHAFQHPLDKITNEKGDIRASIKKLIDIYGEPLERAVLNGYRPVNPDDFDNTTLRDFVKRVLDFQRQHLISSLDDDYKEYLNDEAFKDLIPADPVFLTAPYFYMTRSNYQRWSNLNKHLLEVTREVASGSERIFGELVIDQEFLLHISKDKEVLKKMLENYKIADGIAIWIDDFNEHSAPQKTLCAAVNFVKHIKEKFPDKSVINLYGGYFSELMLKIGLDGVVHGPEYGEFRAVVPVGGGIPIAKFYYPDLKCRIPSNEILYWLKPLEISSPKGFFKEICSCKVCHHYINNSGNVRESFRETYGKTEPVQIKGRKGKLIDREYPVAETTENCLAHYLEVKKNEFDNVAGKDLKILLEELAENYRKYKPYFDIWLDEKEFNHLLRWEKALKG